MTTAQAVILGVMLTLTPSVLILALLLTTSEVDDDG
jgi:hypothetical protein